MDYFSFIKALPILVILFGRAHLSTITRFRSNMVIYDLYDTNARKVIYSNSEKAEWKDLNELVKRASLRGKALVCGSGPGTWVAYPGSDYQLGNNTLAAWLIVGETCIAADDINSAQAVGPINAEYMGLVTFTAPYFTSDATLVSNDSDTASGVQSLISPGGGVEPSNWTIEGDGKKYCIVRPASLTSIGVCFLSNIPLQLGMKEGTIKVGCDGMEISDPVFLLDTCFLSAGAYKIMDTYFTFPVMSQICSGSGDNAQQLGFYKIYDVWKFRMNPNRQAEYNPANIDKDRRDELNPTRMKILNYFFAIFKESCPLLPGEYFNLVRFLYMQHIKSVWEEAPEILSDKNDTKAHWRKAEAYLQNCYGLRKSQPIMVPADQPTGLDLCIMSKHPSFSAKPAEEGMALDLFLQGDNLDHIMEHIWLMLNLVSPFCANAMGYRDNFWVDFVSLFRRQFLLPLLQQWVNPGPWQTYYEYMFNGYSLADGKRRVISCVQKTISSTPDLDPIDRPSAHAKEFAAISKKRPPAEIKEPDEKKPKEKKNRKRQARNAGPDDHRSSQQRRTDRLKSKSTARKVFVHKKNGGHGSSHSRPGH